MDAMMDALSEKRKGLVLKIELDPNGKMGTVEVMPEGGEALAQEAEEMPGEEMEDQNKDNAPALSDEDLVGGMTDYDKEQTLAGPPKSLGGKARAAALERMKQK